MFFTYKGQDILPKVLTRLEKTENWRLKTENLRLKTENPLIFAFKQQICIESILWLSNICKSQLDATICKTIHRFICRQGNKRKTEGPWNLKTKLYFLEPNKYMLKKTWQYFTNILIANQSQSHKFLYLLPFHSHYSQFQFLT